MPNKLRKRNVVLDWLLAWPIVDLGVPFAAIGAWAFFGYWLPSDLLVLDSFYSSITATAGIILAASTFVASQIYYSQGSYMTRLRRQYVEELLRNWTHILVSLLLATLLPLLSVLLSSGAPRIAFCLALFSVSLAAIRAIRVVWWFRLTHRLLVISMNEPGRIRTRFKDID